MEELFSFSNGRLLVLLRSGLPEGSPLKLEVRGWSMFPSIKDGDTVVVSSASESRVRLGTIVVFVHRLSGKVLMHRVIGWQKGMYLIKGDTLLHSDGLIAGRDILGIVIKVLGRDGKEAYSPVWSRLWSVVLSRTRVISCVVFFFKCLPLSFRKAVKKRISPV